MRKPTGKLHARPKATPASSSRSKPVSSATRQPESQSPQKRKYSPEFAPQEQSSDEPESKRTKVADTPKLEGRPLRQAQVPESSRSRAAPIPTTFRTDKHQHVSAKPDTTTPRKVEFGALRCLDDTKASINLRAFSNELSCYAELIVGRDQSCGITVIGPDVGKLHCKLILEQWKPDELPLRRRVWIERTDLARPVYSTSLWKGKGWVQLKESEILSDGDCVRFGNGPRLKYEPPKLSDLYKAQDQLHGKRETKTNSSVFRVKRLSDNFSFVAKAIDQKHVKMAHRELDAFKILGYHPHITQFIEVFYDKLESTHHIVLEAAQTDLDKYVSRMGPHRHRNIIDQAPQIIGQASSAIAHVHSRKMAHRDLKPENVLISITELGNIKLKICDFGLARVSPQPVLKNRWLAGTPDWMAPASFMTYPNDERLVDCYEIGRLPYFLLSSSAWPTESRNPDAKCGCETICPSFCVERTLAFNTLVNAGMGKNAVHFLKGLLVGDPDECMDIGEILEHAYLTKAVSELTPK